MIPKKRARWNALVGSIRNRSVASPQEYLGFENIANLKMIPPEYDEQCALVEYCESKGFLFTHIPHETYTTSWNQKLKNKKQGVRKGFPDMCVVLSHEKVKQPCPLNLVLFIEMKRQRKKLKNGKLSKSNSKVSGAQQIWIDNLNSVAGGCYAKVCYGFEEAREFIESFLNKT